MSGSRNPTIEAYRCCMMFGICLLHATAANSIGFGRYNSPTTLIAAALSFSLASENKISETAGRVAAWAAPSMFSVYLLQTNDMGIDYEKDLHLR